MRVFVTATNTDVGKTHTTLLLMEEAAKQGWRPGVVKPVETGVGVNGPPDGRRLLAAMHRLNPDTAAITLEEVVPVRFALPAAPYVAAEGRPIPLAPILAAVEKIGALCDTLFIEGAGGLMVPVSPDPDGGGVLYMIDFVTLLGASALLVAPGGLGSINDTLLSLQALQERGHTPFLAINPKSEQEREAFGRVTRPFYDAVSLAYHLLPDDAGRLLQALRSCR